VAEGVGWNGGSFGLDVVPCRLGRDFDGVLCLFSVTSGVVTELLNVPLLLPGGCEA
jgi:hypothetical protein